ncbi:uncharacterized protein MAM_04940 [Metarhizium album ARSEF 1941]|uniref:Uncharacterized protein n=1 Tax=Metarhizium album (strain ARSEF 1941) TaxID=1081103 RepID=A0A0B2WTH6_METAS|nr:uncharacterized protein MAM_04940 [Metarhizium album ARSEF 1941]KHN97343.1 hypothetical protein MAM_04940 [Metarhizium album ARSEF 1941]
MKSHALLISLLAGSALALPSAPRALGRRYDAQQEPTLLPHAPAAQESGASNSQDDLKPQVEAQPEPTLLPHAPAAQESVASNGQDDLKPQVDIPEDSQKSGDDTCDESVGAVKEGTSDTEGLQKHEQEGTGFPALETNPESDVKINNHLGDFETPDKQAETGSTTEATPQSVQEPDPNGNEVSQGNVDNSEVDDDSGSCDNDDSDVSGDGIGNGSGGSEGSDQGEVASNLPTNPESMPEPDTNADEGSDNQGEVASNLPTKPESTPESNTNADEGSDNQGEMASNLQTPESTPESTPEPNTNADEVEHDEKGESCDDDNNVDDKDQMSTSSRSKDEMNSNGGANCDIGKGMSTYLDCLADSVVIPPSATVDKQKCKDRILGRIQITPGLQEQSAENQQKWVEEKFRKCVGEYDIKRR